MHRYLAAVVGAVLLTACASLDAVEQGRIDAELPIGEPMEADIANPAL